MTYMLFVLLASFAAVSYAGEDCFDKEKSHADFITAKAECKEKFPEGTPDRLLKVTGCTLIKKGIVSEDGSTMDYHGKYRPLYFQYNARDLTEEVAEMDKCWEAANESPKTFFECWAPKVMEMCPDSKKWNEDVLQ